MEKKVPQCPNHSRGSADMVRLPNEEWFRCRPRDGRKCLFTRMAGDPQISLESNGRVKAEFSR
jgi:hypothetical protein